MSRTQEWVWRGIAAIVGLLGVFGFSRDFWLSGFTMFHSDIGDGRFTALVASHWADVTQFGGWTDLGFFAPVEHTLGFSDTMLAFGVIVAPLMWLGMGALPAFQWSLIIVLALGYGAMLAFLRQGPRSAWPLAIVGAALWNFSNATFIGSGHPQMLAFVLLPVVLWGVLRTVRAHAVVTRIAWGIGTGLVFGLLLTTAFYVGWFGALAGGITVSIWALLAALTRQWRVRWKPFFVGALSAVVGVLLIAPVFAGAYLPVLSAAGRRTIEDVLPYAINPIELVNVTPTNLVWGRFLVAALGPGMRIGESMMAPTIGVLVVAGIALIIGLIKLRRLNVWSLLGLALIATGFTLWITPVDFGSIEPWRVLFGIPGASAIRAVGRIETLVAGLLALGSVLIASQWWTSTVRPRAVRTAVIVIACFLLIEQVNTAPLQGIPAAKAASLEAVAAPPARCTSFVLVPPFDADMPWYETQIDAIWISRSIGLPTWNGYSGVFPRDWALRSDMGDYMRSLRAWKTMYRIQGGCGYNLADGTWLSPAELGMLIDRSAGWGKPAV